MQAELDKAAEAKMIGKGKKGFAITDSKRYQELYFDKPKGRKKDMLGAKKTTY